MSGLEIERKLLSYVKIGIGKGLPAVVVIYNKDISQPLTPFVYVSETIKDT